MLTNEQEAIRPFVSCILCGSLTKARGRFRLDPDEVADFTPRAPITPGKVRTIIHPLCPACVGRLGLEEAARRAILATMHELQDIRPCDVIVR